MIILNTPKVLSETQFIDEPEIFITGSSKNGTRMMKVSFPVLNKENGERIDTIYKEYTGEDFNNIYQNFYATDRALIVKSLEDANIEVTASEIPTDLVNPVETVEDIIE